jgi:ferredoxin
MCFLLAPEVFGVDDDGRGVVIQPDIDSAQEEFARVAQDRCPERAISITAPPTR